MANQPDSKHHDMRAVERLFHAALELSADDREEYLSQQCGDDLTLRQKVEQLIALDRDSAAFLADPLMGTDFAIPCPNADQDPSGATLGNTPITKNARVGPYRLQRQIGVGGMGSVWLAERVDGVFDQNVAVKLIKRGMDTDEILRRFHQERQVLAQLDHPYIARLLDGGATDEGVPYLVMEYIDGLNVAAYCEHRCLPLADRLTLFGKICAAVQTAHQNLIVHRDLKPGNILVTTNGDPKLLDFGIAKLLSGSTAPTDAITTKSGVRLATPRYASPEQIRGDRITTGSDVYSLGIVLYELLTGAYPYPQTTRTSAGYEHAILNVDPTPPSHATGRHAETHSTDTTDVPTTAQFDRTWSKRLSGDLDTIILKAIHKDPTQRYGSVEQFADDIDRFQNGLPIVARRATRVYKLRKLISRNKALTTVATFSVVMLIAAAVVSFGFALSEAHQRTLLATQLDETQRQAAIAQAVNNFLNEDLLSAADPFENPDPNEPVRSVLDRAAVRIEDQFPDEPLVEASIRMVLAQAYINLGEHDVAETHIVAAISILESETEPGDAREIHARTILADLHAERAQFEEAEEIYRKQLAIAEQTLGPNDEQTLAIITGLGITLWERGQYDEATDLARRAVKGQRELWGADHANTVRALTGLTSVLTDAAKYDEAESAARQAYESSLRVFGEKHVTVSTCLDNLGRVLIFLHRPKEAVPLFERSLAISKELVGDEHLHTLITMTNVATGYQRLQRWDEAEALLKKSIAVKLRTIGATHPSTLIGKQTLANQYRKLGRLQDAVRLNREVFEGRKVALGENHPSTLYSMNNLALTLNELGNHAAAADLHTETLELRRERYGDNHPLVATSLNGLAHAYHQSGLHDEAARYYREALQIRSAKLGDDHPSTANTMLGLARVLVDLDNTNEAFTLAQRVREIEVRKLPPDHPRHIATATFLAPLLIFQEQFEEAEVILEAAVEILQSRQTINHDRTSALLDAYQLLYAASALDDPHRLAKVTQLLARNSETESAADKDDEP